MFLVGISILFTSCENIMHPTSTKSPIDIATEKKAIGNMLDSFNIAASKADYTSYFQYFSDKGIFIGTDASEHWDKQQFMIWAKPFFDKKKTWHFTSIERHIYLNNEKNIAWFDELLNTQMKICRGSGVVEKINHEWKMNQYVLSMTIPNNLSDKITELKTPIEDSMIKQLSIQ